MKTNDFDYHLPDELIAYFPIEKRSESKLLVSSNDSLQHKIFKDITSYFKKGDLLVLNNTSVIPARIYGKKESGGSVEIMLERIMENNTALVQIKSGRSPRIGSCIFFNKYSVQCIDRKDNFFIIQFEQSPLSIFNSIGHIPLPPYIKRPDEDLDKERYATVYENKNLQNSVAAPTAGLHFDKELLQNIQELGVEIDYVNLSVGAGTFQPVKVDNIKDHDIHEEYLEVTPGIVDKVNKVKLGGGRVFSVGTTAARALETAFIDESFKGYEGYTTVSYTHLTLPTILLV